MAEPSSCNAGRRSRPGLVELREPVSSQRSMRDGAAQPKPGFAAPGGRAPLGSTAPGGRSAGGGRLLRLDAPPMARRARERRPTRRRREARAVAAARALASCAIRRPHWARRCWTGLRGPGDIALLFRRLAHVDLFQGALAEGRADRRITLGGRWILGTARSARRSRHILSALIDPRPGSDRAWRSRRSPLCGIPERERGALRLRRVPRGRLPRCARSWEGLPAGLPADSDRAELVKLGERLRDLYRAARGLGAGRSAGARPNPSFRIAGASTPTPRRVPTSTSSRRGCWRCGRLEVQSLAACVRRLAPPRP